METKRKFEYLAQTMDSISNGELSDTSSSVASQVKFDHPSLSTKWNKVYQPPPVKRLCTNHRQSRKGETELPLSDITEENEVIDVCSSDDDKENHDLHDYFQPRLLRSPSARKTRVGAKRSVQNLHALLM